MTRSLSSWFGTLSDVPIQKLATAPAFVVVDIEGQPATGLVRMARKILQGSASDMARSATYTFAAFGIQRSGASAGINAEGDARSEALANFVAELTPTVVDGDLHLDPAKGISVGGIEELFAGSARKSAVLDPRVQVAGVVAAAGWALGGSLQGKTVVLEGAALGPIPAALGEAVIAAGATIVDVPGVDKKPWLIWGADVDVILCGSKLGALTHQGAEFVKAKAVVPWATTPVTTKAFAALLRAGVTVVPDFVSAGGALIAGYLDSAPSDVEGLAAVVADRVVEVLTEADKHDDGVLLGACYLAEAFLDSWVDERPFGRPLAS